MHSYIEKNNQLLTSLNLAVPTLGKTGTANQFRNSAYGGYIPGVDTEKKGLVLKDGYALAAYIGYDDNTPMVRNSTHITGASGALRLWTDAANFIINENSYADNLGVEQLSFVPGTEVPLYLPELGQVQVPSDKDVHVQVISDDPLGLGSPVGQDSAKVGHGILSFGEITGNGIKPKRYFKPYWDQDL